MKPYTGGLSGVLFASTAIIVLGIVGAINEPDGWEIYGVIGMGVLGWVLSILHILRERRREGLPPDHRFETFRYATIGSLMISFFAYAFAVGEVRSIPAVIIGTIISFSCIYKSIQHYGAWKHGRPIEESGD
jgi:hypothetical protein